MSNIRSFRDLEVWQQGMKLASQIYQVTKSFPREEIFGLTSQMRRAAVSIPSNIAEGQCRGGTKEFIQFLLIARGSLGELVTQVLLSTDLKLIPTDASTSIQQQTDTVGRLLNGLIRSLRQ